MKFLHPKKKQNLNNNLVNQRPFFKRMGRDVHVDWSLSVISAFIIMVVLVVAGLLLGNSFDVNLNAEKKAVLIKDNSANDNITLDKVLDKYDKKLLKRELLIQNYVGPSDPSI
jgi:hypothetical protein